MPEYFSLSGDISSESLPESLRTNPDWAVIQLKLGVGSADNDLALLQKALQSAAQHQLILADFNGALAVPDAIRIVQDFNDHRLVWEEPCSTVDENHEVVASTGKPVMFDQCLTDPGEIVRVISSKLAHSIVIKPAFLGGLQTARMARDLCVAAKLPFRIDGPWCGHIATAANLHLACGASPGLLICGCDLRQPLVIDEDWGGTRHLDKRRIAPLEAPGHGIDPEAWNSQWR